MPPAKDYAVVLHFDRDGEARLDAVVRAAARECGNRYMLEQRIPPHLTLAMFRCADVAPVVEAIEAELAGFPRREIEFAAIEAFAPRVVYASPVKDAALAKANLWANALVAALSELDGEGAYYLPDRWLPHATLATKLSDAQFPVALRTAQEGFAPFRAVCDRLALAECNPYKSLKVWTLDQEKEDAPCTSPSS